MALDVTHRRETASEWALARIDAIGNRCFGPQANPLYQSGTLVVALYLVLVVTGLWLILFYRIGQPWESVAGVTANPWVGNWVRGLHRFSSDAAIVILSTFIRSWSAS